MNKLFVALVPFLLTAVVGAKKVQIQQTNL